MATNIGSWAPRTKDGSVKKKPTKVEWQPEWALEDEEEAEEDEDALGR